MEGEWIWLSQEQEEDTYGEFVLDYDALGTEEVYLDVSADSDYALYCDEQLIYGGQYADFPWYKISDRLPLPKQKGHHVLRLIGYHGGDLSFTHYLNHAAVRFALWEGNHLLLTSSPKILSRIAPYFVSGVKKKITWQLGYSFTLDPTKKGGSFFPSRLVEGMPKETTLRPIERLEYQPLKKGISLGNHGYDFQEETVGYPAIKATIPLGKEVVVSFGEWLNEERKPQRHIGERDFSFVLKGSGKEETYLHPIRKLGLRYLSFEGEIDVKEVSLLPVLYPSKEKKVVLDSPLHQKIYDVALRTLRLNMMEHYFDCPWREQSFYGLDSRFSMRYGYAALEGSVYQREALHLMSEDRNWAGLLSITIPTSHPMVIPSFALAYVMAMNDYWKESGDSSLIQKYFPRMKQIIDCILDHRKDGLVGEFQEENLWNFYEWMPHLDGSELVPVDAAINGFTLMGLLSFISAGKAIGEEMGFYRQAAKEIQAKMNEVFFDASRHAYRFSKDGVYSVLVNALAILGGAVSPQEMPFVAKHLVSPKPDFIEATLSMKSLVYDALLEADPSYASWIIKDIDRCYSYMLEQGATSFWETLKGKDDFDGAGSLCHAWSALPLYYYPLCLKQLKKIL